MDLHKIEASSIKYNGNEIIQLEAGDKINIKIKKDGIVEEVLDDEVPVGKIWELFAQVNVVETDL